MSSTMQCLLPGAPLTQSELDEIKKIDALDLNAEEIAKQKNKKLAEFDQHRHENELEQLKKEDTRRALEKLADPKFKEPRINPWDATRYKNAGQYKLHKAYMQLINESPFLANLSRYVRFQPTSREDVQTAGVRYDMRLNEFVLEYNSAFLHWIEDVHSIAGPIFVLKHEMWHLVLGHVTDRLRTPHGAWNLATDTVINKMCASSGHTVPEWVIFPGRRSKNTWGDDPFDKLGIPHTKAVLTIESWNPDDDHSSEWYFSELMKNADESDPGQSQDGHGTFDSHNWDVVMFSDEDGNDMYDGQGGAPSKGDFTVQDFQEFISEKARSLVEKAVREADEHPNGWGNMSSDIANAIRRMTSRQVDWKTLLKQFYGKTIRGGRKCSIKRINRKYPMIHPGVSRGYDAKILAAIDESGSVGNEAIEMLFAELGNCAKDRDIDVVPFDTKCEEKNLIMWKKGRPAPTQRDYCGGTCFDAPTRYANDRQNRGRWDGLIILTDGMAPRPSSSRLRRAWILTPGCKLNFEVPGETVIHMDNDGKKPFTAWK